MTFHYVNIIKVYRKVCDQFGNILSLTMMSINIYGTQ